MYACVRPPVGLWVILGWLLDCYRSVFYVRVQQKQQQQQLLLLLKTRETDTHPTRPYTPIDDPCTAIRLFTLFREGLQCVRPVPSSLANEEHPPLADDG